MDRAITLSHSAAVAEELDALRTELADLAFALDRRGQPAAAEVVLWTSGRLADLCADLGRGGGDRNVVRKQQLNSLSGSAACAHDLILSPARGGVFSTDPGP